MVVAWAAARIVFWNGYYVEDSPGYVGDAITAALGYRFTPSYVNGLNVGTYLPVALPIRLAGKTEIALSIWPASCSLLGMIALWTLAAVLFGRWFGLLAALLYATYPGDVFFSTVVMPDAIQAGWITVSMCAIGCAIRAAPSRTLWWSAGAGVALGFGHLIRANAVIFLPAGVCAVAIVSRVRGSGARASDVVHACAAYVAGWSSVLVVEGIVYFVMARDFLLRFHVVENHYGTRESIREHGLNVDSTTIVNNLFAPLTWVLRGRWGTLAHDQAYHALLFVFAVAALLAGATAVAIRPARASDRAKAGLAMATAWLVLPIVYHQFGSQSLTAFVPMHRLSRQFVVYGPGAMFAIVAGGYALSEAVRDRPYGRRALATAGCLAMAVHLSFNWQGESIAWSAFHRVKATYARIRDHLPSAPATIVGDPGDLVFFDFWMNPPGETRVRTVSFGAYASCAELRDAVVLTRSNPGWFGVPAAAIEEAVRRLPCLAHPPPDWRLLYGGYPEQAFVVESRTSWHIVAWQATRIAEP
jgi:hypothetical protein